MISWVSRDREERLFENTIDIFLIVNTRNSAIICKRRVEKSLSVEHNAYMCHHIFPMSMRHLLEEDEISSLYFLKWVYHTESIIDEYRRHISDICMRKYEVTRVSENIAYCRDTVSMIWSIRICCSCLIYSRYQLLCESLKHFFIQFREMMRAEYYFHSFCTFLIIRRSPSSSRVSPIISISNHRISSVSSTCLSSMTVSEIIPRNRIS